MSPTSNLLLDRRGFQLYLLASMRARRAVADALARLDAVHGDLAIAVATAERTGFAEIGHPARLYATVLGAPVASQPDESADANSSFAGSIADRYELELWPDFDYVVRRTPEGVAWGMGFVRRLRITIPPLATVADLAPWRFVESEIAARFGGRRSEDAWSGWEDVSYEIPASPAAPARRYVLAFDRDLLQTITAVEDDPPD
jgi:hypothetical protein